MIRYDPVWSGMARYGPVWFNGRCLRRIASGRWRPHGEKADAACGRHRLPQLQQRRSWCGASDCGAEWTEFGCETMERSTRERGIALELGPKGERMRVFHATPAMISIILYQVSVSKELTANHSKFRLQLLTEVHSNLAVESLSSCQ